MTMTSVHCLKYCLGLAPAITQTSLSERQCLSRYASGCKSIVEIGVFHGVNTRMLCEVADRNATIYAVDPFFRGRAGVSFNRIVARLHVGKAAKRRVVWIRDVSPGAASEKYIPSSTIFDFIFIDGDHSYDAIALDWRTWVSKLCVGGCVALHDSRGGHGAGSERFTEDEVARDPNFVTVETIDTLTMLRRVS